MSCCLYVSDVARVDHADLPRLKRYVNGAIRCNCLSRHHRVLHEKVRLEEVVGKTGRLDTPADLGVLFCNER